MSYYFRIKFKSPVTFQNVRITFPKGMIYNSGRKSIIFHHWENPTAFLLVAKMNSNKMKKEALIKFFKKKGFYVLETTDAHFKGYRSFTISYIDTSWKHKKVIYIISKNLRITYQGTRENYQEFQNIMDSMEFL